MTRTHLSSAIAIVLLLATAPAWAEKDGTTNDEGVVMRERTLHNGRARQQDIRVDQRDYRQRSDQRNDGRYGDQRHDGRYADQRYGRYESPPYYQAQRGDGRGAGPDHQYYRGDRLPPNYRGSYYVVDDWRGHQLSAPPRGYHWVQTGSDYVLIAIATGIILQMLLAN